MQHHIQQIGEIRSKWEKQTRLYYVRAGFWLLVGAVVIAGELESYNEWFIDRIYWFDFGAFMIAITVLAMIIMAKILLNRPKTTTIAINA